MFSSVIHVLKCLLVALPLLVGVSKPIWHECSELSHQKKAIQTGHQSLSFEASEYECEICDIELPVFYSTPNFSIVSQEIEQIDTYLSVYRASFSTLNLLSTSNKGPPIDA